MRPSPRVAAKQGSGIHSRTRYNGKRTKSLPVQSPLVAILNRQADTMIRLGGNHPTLSRPVYCGIRRICHGAEEYARPPNVEIEKASENGLAANPSRARLEKAGIGVDVAELWSLKC
jgi:hypothetical protein